MDSEDECCAAAIVVAITSKKRKRKRQKRQRSVWVKPWLTRRNELGVGNTLLEEFRLENDEEYKQFLRMSPENFEELLSLVEKEIQKQNTLLRDAIPARMRLAATIRFLATGNSYADLQYLFRIHKSTLAKFIPKICEVLYEQLKEKYLKVNMPFCTINA